MFLDLLFGGLPRLRCQPDRRAIFLMLLELDDLPLAFLGGFLFVDWAEILLRVVFAPRWGAGRGHRTITCWIVILWPYRSWAPIAYEPRR